MARKKKVLTPEERLAAALVPEDEQPYEVPDNWCWTAGRNAFEPMETTVPNGDTFRYIDIDAVDNVAQVINEPKVLPVNKAPSRARRKLHPGDTVFSLVRPYLRNIAHIAPELADCIASTGFFVCTPGSCLDSYFLYQLMRSPYVVDGLNSHMKGDNSPSIRKSDVEAFPFPLPPLPEQLRIVERIESLFAKLDEAEANLRMVIDGSDQRIRLILCKAFSGELTSAWRKTHAVSQESWVTRTLGSVCRSIYDGDHMPPPKTDVGVPFLVISNVNKGYLSFEGTRFVPQDYYDGLTKTRRPEVGDVLYTIVGSYGIPAIVDDDRPFCFQRHMALLKPLEVETRFLWYLLRSQEMYDKATSIATGTAQLTVPIRGLRQMEFKCPSKIERDEIVRLLDLLLDKEEASRIAAMNALSAIDVLKQTILVKAMRGELGTNDPKESSSTEYLLEMFSNER